MQCLQHLSKSQRPLLTMFVLCMGTQVQCHAFLLHVLQHACEMFIIISLNAQYFINQDTHATVLLHVEFVAYYTISPISSN